MGDEGRRSGRNMDKLEIIKMIVERINKGFVIGILLRKITLVK
jgi:hypothetical protein